MNRVLAIVVALLLAARPTNFAAAWQSSCGDCCWPCDPCATPAPTAPAPAPCGCDASVLADGLTPPQSQPAAERIAPLPEPTSATEKPAPLAPVPVEPVAKPTLPLVTPTPDAQTPATPTEESFPAPTGEPTPPAVEPAPPADQPITPTEEPATPTEQPAAPVEQPTTPVEDIFGGGAEPATSEPAAPDAAPTAAETPAQEAPAESAPATEPAAQPPAEAPKASDIFDSLGASSNTRREPGGWASTAVRTWNDPTGLHACEARLTEITAEEVVLARVDGGTVRVPYRQLSVADLRFVRRQIEARRTQLAQASETVVASQSP